MPSDLKTLLRKCRACEYRAHDVRKLSVLSSMEQGGHQGEFTKPFPFKNIGNGTGDGNFS